MSMAAQRNPVVPEFGPQKRTEETMMNTILNDLAASLSEQFSRAGGENGRRMQVVIDVHAAPMKPEIAQETSAIVPLNAPKYRRPTGAGRPS
jgi:hypothetical protein